MAEKTVSQVTPTVKETNPIHVDFLNCETPAVLSTDVACHFQKKHQHILRDIDRDALAREGLTERQLVQCLTLRYRLTERYVWRILKRPTPDIPEPRMQQASLL